MMLILKLKVVVVKVLKDEGYIVDYVVSGEVKFEFFIELKYFEGKVVIENIQCVSCFGLCIYKKCDELLKVMGGFGIVIVLIFKGLMIDCVVCSVGVGGEIIGFVV